MKASLLLFLLLLPSVFAEEGLPGELRALIQESRVAYEAAHAMPPSLERNEALSKTKLLIKSAQAKHALLKEVAPAQAKSFAADITDLQSMLFWANKSMVVVVPPAPPQQPPPPAQVAPEPPGAEAAPPPPSDPVLSAAQRQAMLSLCTELGTLFGKVEACQDAITDTQRRVADLFKLLEGIQGELKAKGSNWNFVKDCEARRAVLLERLHRSRKGIAAKTEEIRAHQARILACRSGLEWHQGLLPPVVAEWASRNPAEGVPEGMVGYMNAVLNGKAELCFTPVPAAASFPPEPSLPAGKVREVRALLDELSDLSVKESDLADDLRCQEDELDLLQKELKDLTAHWDWRVSNTAYGVSEAKRMEGLKAQLAADQARLEGEIGKDRLKLEKLRRRLEDAQDKLGKVELDCVRVVEAWRLSKKILPASLSSSLEAWTRRALGP